ncbi:MAG: hypothetical protein U0237_19780 [Thermoleophilia bacterium]
MTRTRTAAALAAIATLVTAPTAISAPSDVERSLESAAQRAQASTLGERQERGTFTAQGLIGTPGVFSDAIGDSSLAPDLQGMVVGVDETGTFGTLIRLNSNSLLEGDVVATYVDTDGNQATGSPTFDGADVAVYIIGQIGTDSVAFLRWNGTAMVAAPMPPSLGSVWDGATDEFWSASLTDLGIAPGTRVGILFATLYIGTYDTYSDFAPEPGYGAFTVDIPGPVSAPPAHHDAGVDHARHRAASHRDRRHAASAGAPHLRMSLRRVGRDVRCSAHLARCHRPAGSLPAAAAVPGHRAFVRRPNPQGARREPPRSHPRRLREGAGPGAGNAQQRHPSGDPHENAGIGGNCGIDHTRSVAVQLV